eukprot:8212826-Karenia_brevis.AAC.1
MSTVVVIVAVDAIVVEVLVDSSCGRDRSGCASATICSLFATCPCDGVGASVACAMWPLTWTRDELQAMCWLLRVE